MADTAQTNTANTAFNNETITGASLTKLQASNNTSNFVSNYDNAWQLGMAQPNKQVNIMTKAITNGQLGVGIKAPALDVATPLVLPPAIVVVLQVPAMYTDANSNATAMGLAIKDLLESHAKTISNIDIQYTMNTVDPGAPAGFDGQSFSAPGKTTRERVTPQFSFNEITGNLYWNIIHKWITDMNNPDTFGIGAGAAIHGAWTMSDYSATLMIIQPDITQRPERIIDASVICNVFPTQLDVLGMARDVTGSNSMKNPDRSVTFQGILQHNTFTKMLGVYVMKQLRLHTLDFNWAPPQRNMWTQDLNNFGLPQDITERYKYYGRTAINDKEAGKLEINDGKKWTDNAVENANTVGTGVNRVTS